MSYNMDAIHDTNQVGWQGYTIMTPSGSPMPNYVPWSHEADWETYTGTYEPPAGQSVTRFTYRSILSILILVNFSTE